MYPIDVFGWRVGHMCEFHVVCGIEVLLWMHGSQLCDFLWDAFVFGSASWHGGLGCWFRS